MRRPAVIRWRLLVLGLLLGALLGAGTGFLLGSWSLGGEYVVYDCPGVRELVRELERGQP